MLPTDTLPTDSLLLLSFVNTKLRDYYPTLESLCAAYGVGMGELCKRISYVNYFYDAKTNQFKQS